MSKRQASFFVWKLFLLTALGIFLILAANCLLHLPSELEAGRLIKYILNAANAFICVALGVLVGWRRAGSRTMRTLALILVSMPVAWLTLALPTGLARDAVVQSRPFAVCFIYSAFLYFTLQFPAARPLIEQHKVRITFFVFTVFFAAVCAFRIMGPYVLQASRVSWLFATITVLASLVALWRAWVQAAGTERQRIGWVALCLGMIFATFATYVMSSFLGNDLTGSNLANVLDAIQLAAIVALAYAMMRYRLFDVGLAINRTLVFSATSVLLILAFFLSERAAHSVLHFEGRSVWFDGSIAFVLFFCFNRLHHRIDHLVERILFGSWHKNAAALRHFVQKSAHYDDAGDLRMALGQELERFTGGAAYAIYRAGADGRLAFVAATLDGAPDAFGANEDLAVSLRMSHKNIDVSTTRWAHGGDIALPMMQGAKLDGLVILGHKPSGDNYRPDEIEALAFAVAQVGLILFALRVDKLEKQNVELAQRADQDENKLGFAMRELDTMRILLRAPAR